MACCNSCAKGQPKGCAGRAPLGRMDPQLHREALAEQRAHPWINHAQAMQIARDHRAEKMGANRVRSRARLIKFAPTQTGPRLIRAGEPGSLGFVGPMLQLFSAINTARALGGPGECPEPRTAGGRTYSEPWTGYNDSPRKGPSFSALSDWYDKAEEELDRYAKHPKHDAAELAAMRKRWDDLPNRYQAMIDGMGAALLARDLARRALCLWHDAQFNDAAAKGLPKLPKPLPAEEIGDKIDQWVKDKFSIPWWAYLAAGAAVYVWASNKLPRRRD